MNNIKLKARAEIILRKQAENPKYMPTKKERGVLKKHNILLLNERKKQVSDGKKALKTKNSAMQKRRKAKTSLPDSVQKTIPYVADYAEGLFEVAPGLYSKCYEMTDVNYSISNEDDQTAMFVKYGEFLNYFDETMFAAVTIDNRVISLSEQEAKILYKETGDSYDAHRLEYNSILRRQMQAGYNDISRRKYVCVTIPAETPIEALLRFHKTDADIVLNLRRIGAEASVMTTQQRLELLHDKLRPGREGQFGGVDFDWLKAQGVSGKDYIAPSSFDFTHKSYFMVEDTFNQCLYVTNLPTSLSDGFLTDLADVSFPMTTTISIQPVAQDKALRLVKKQLTGMEANKIEAQKKAVRAGYDPNTIHHDLLQSLSQAEELLDDMTQKSQKLFFVTITVQVRGKSLEELNENVKHVENTARKYTCQLQRLDYLQEQAFKVNMPMGIPAKGNLCVERALTTESTAVFMPFSSQELFQPGGFYYGLNQLSRNLIICNRTAMRTPSGFVLGSSGSGKSFAAKREMLNVLLNDGLTGLIVIDPENEYGGFARAFGGTVLKISADSENYINPMDMPPEYGLDEDDGDDVPLSVMKAKALKKKSDYIMSIIERMISGGAQEQSGITPQQKTIIDRCVTKCYRRYLDNDFDTAHIPTLLDLQRELDIEGEESADAKHIAEGTAYYTRGSMNIFANKTNVDTQNRFVVFNVRDLGDQLRQIALIIVFDFIWNRMIENKNKGLRTYCYCDEIHVLFSSYYSAYFLKQLYKRGRKYGLVITGITQNCEELLKSDMAKSMIGNSDFILMLNQSSEDLRVLAAMLNISPAQMSFVDKADAGSGLLFAQKVIVPFADKFPKDSYLYELISTNFNEVVKK